jgi:glycosyltransferase involved in cell wall biosynthesis
MSSESNVGNSPTVSVVMSVFNDARYLRQSMESVLSQAGVDFEFVIVDDGSTDESREILREYAANDSRVRVILQPNQGLTKALIAGCNAAQGRYIARQDADDISLPGRISIQSKLLSDNPKICFVSCQAEVIGPQGEILNKHRRPTDPNEATDLLLHGGSSPPGHGSVMFRRDAYIQAGGYRQEFYFAQDCDLWFRLAEIGLLGYSGETLYQYRLDPSSVSGARQVIKREFSAAVDECRRFRLDGKNEKPVLDKCIALRTRIFEKTASSEAATLYFIARNSFLSHPRNAASYLLKSLRGNPFYLKAWLLLLAIPFAYSLSQLKTFFSRPVDIRSMDAHAEEFYNKVYSSDRYATFCDIDEHFAARSLIDFVSRYDLHHSRCLEVGSGRGAFQDLVADYTGLDLSSSVAEHYRKPFFNGSAENLPFPDNDFDAIWSITVLEHIPSPERALYEMRRVLKPGGMLFLKPAWNCRPWICEGIPVRPYSDLNLRQKWIKLTLPLRDSVWWRALKMLPRRLWKSLNQNRQGIPLRFQKLNANYETFWMVDSDACSSIDPFDAIQWFRSRGDDVVSHPTWRSAFLSRSEHLVVQVNK